MFLEAALFDPITTAKTGRKLGILSDARYRNERGLDPQSELWGLDVATRLILEICGGEASRVVRAGTPPSGTKVVPYHPSLALQLGGVAIADIDVCGSAPCLTFTGTVATGQTVTLTNIIFNEGNI